MKVYLRHKIENVVDIKELFALEYLDFGGKYKDYVESHDFWELCFVESGELILSTNLENFKVNAGEAVLIPPSNKHSYKEIVKCKAFVMCFESSSPALRPIANEIINVSDEQFSAIKIIINETKSSFIMNDEDHLEVLKNPLFGGQQVIIAQLEYFLICAARQFSSSEKSNIIFLGEDSFYADLVSVIIKYFSKNIRNRLNLDKICKKFNCSRSFLCRTFKQETGVSIMAFFNEMKIEEAKNMLINTNISAAKIADELGFSDAKYFGYLFKKETGFTPAAFRKNCTKEDIV